MVAECQTEPRFEIYALVDPLTDEIRYVGKSKDASKRFKGHMRDRLRRDYPVYRWINKLAGRGLFPTVRVIEVCADWEEAERRLIAVSRARGDRLLNVAAGGVDIPNTPDCKRHNGERLSKWVHDPKRKRLMQYKRYLSTALKSGHIANRTRTIMRELACKRPDIFGSWADLPDRVE